MFQSFSSVPCVPLTGSFSSVVAVFKCTVPCYRLGTCTPPGKGPKFRELSPSPSSLHKCIHIRFLQLLFSFAPRMHQQLRSAHCTCHRSPSPPLPVGPNLPSSVGGCPFSFCQSLRGEAGDLRILEDLKTPFSLAL